MKYFGKDFMGCLCSILPSRDDLAILAPWQNVEFAHVILLIAAKGIIEVKGVRLHKATGLAIVGAEHGAEVPDGFAAESSGDCFHHCAIAVADLDLMFHAHTLHHSVGRVKRELIYSSQRRDSHQRSCRLLRGVCYTPQRV